MLTYMSVGATLVHQARTSAGLSIRSLAQHAGVSPSTISRIETGRMDPTIGMLQRLLAAVGQELEVSSTSVRVPRLASLVDAWRPSSRGEVIDWTKLRVLLDYLALHPDRTASALRARPKPSGSSLLDNILAAIAETQADDAGVPRPAWTQRVAPLADAWISPGTPRQQEQARLATPPAFAARGITLARSSLWREGMNG